MDEYNFVAADFHSKIYYHFQRIEEVITEPQISVPSTDFNCSNFLKKFDYDGDSMTSGTCYNELLCPPERPFQFIDRCH
jgi:hypothetical protein